MRYLCAEIDTKAGDLIQVRLEGNAANVLLLDHENYEKYHEGESFEYFGGYFTMSPATLRAPRAGHWYAVVDLAGEEGNVDVSVQVLTGKVKGRAAAAEAGAGAEAEDKPKKKK